MINNPFAVFTPEGLTADRVVAIFSTEMPGLGNIENAGHAFVIGTRGSGKSILFRYLEPDCQRLVTAKALNELPFLSLYVSFRETQAQITELARFKIIMEKSFSTNIFWFSPSARRSSCGCSVIMILLPTN